MADNANGSTRSRVLDKDYDVDAGTVTIKFLESGESEVVNIDSLDAATVRRAALHGLVQKFGDAAAGKSGDEAYDAVMAVIERTKAGEWSKARESAGPRPTLVAQAVMRVLSAAGKAFEESAVIAKYTGKDGEAARKHALSMAPVQAAFKTIQAELAAARAAKAAEAAAAVPQADVSSL